MKTILQLDGLDCAVCAGELEEEISKIEGVINASVAFATQKLSLEYEGEETLDKVIYVANHFEEVRVVPPNAKNIRNEGGRVAVNEETPQEDSAKKRRNQWLLIALSALCLVLGAICEYFAATLACLVAVTYVFYAVSYFSVAFPVLVSTAKNIAKGKIFDENFLMTVASIGAICLGEIGEGVAVMLLYQIGETLQAMAVGSSRRSITELMGLKSETVTLIVKGEQITVSAEEVKKGDILLVKAGEKIPVDGCLLSATASLDTKSLTGESELKTVKIGEEMLSGCVNAGAVFKMQALRVYHDSAAQKILGLVENAASGKAKPEKFITKFAKYYTPAICALALVLAVFAPLVNGWIVAGYPYFYNVSRWITSSLTFLVVSCPCALIVSVPLTYFSGVGACAKRGVLVKGATYLDILAQAKTIAFDKTGTLTEGNFTVLKVSPTEAVDESELLCLAAAVEKNSSHPIAKAFGGVRTSYKATDAHEFAGRGIAANIDGAQILVGNNELLKQYEVECPEISSVHTLVFVAKSGKYLGAIELGDKLRAESKATIEGLKKFGFTKLTILTGDRLDRAQAVANEVGVYEVNASLLPDEKLEKAKELKENGLLVYVGDGINDAPVMAVSDCAVSMGKLGSAAAVEASDLVLISDDLGALVHGVKTAKKTRKIVMQNIWFSIVMKTVFMILGAAGILQLWLAVFADVGVMLLAVLNSFRVRK